MALLEYSSVVFGQDIFGGIDLGSVLVDGTRIGGVLLSIVLGWRIYRSATSSAIEAERTSQDRLEAELEATRKRFKADLAELRTELASVKTDLSKCRRDHIDAERRILVLEAERGPE